MKISKILAACVATASVASIAVVAASAADYTAHLAVQTSAFSYQETRTKDNYLEGKFVVWGGNDPETYPEYEDNFEEELVAGGGYVFDTKDTIADIAGNGTYKVGLECEQLNLDNALSFNWIIIDTDIPYEEVEEGVPALTVSGVKVMYDGAVVSTDPAVTVENNNGITNIGILNIWGADEIKKWAPDVEGNPKSKIEVEFTLDGLQAEANIPDDEPADDNTDKPAEETPAKPNTNTGAEGIAVAAGVAVLATGAIVVSKKRK